MQTFTEWFRKKKPFLNFRHEAEYHQDMDRLYRLKRQPNINRIDDSRRDRAIRRIKAKWEKEGYSVKPHKLGEPRTLTGKAKRFLDKLRGK